MPRGSLRCFSQEIFVAPGLVARVVDVRMLLAGGPHGGVEGDACRDRPACAGGRAPASGRRRRRTSAFVVTTMRVFMCTAGTCGFCGCAISEMPEAQKRGSSSAPGNLRAEFRRELAVHGRDVDADLLEDAAVHHRHHAAAARRAGVVGALPRRSHEAARRPMHAGAPAGRSSSTASSAAQISSRSAANQPCAAAYFFFFFFISRRASPSPFRLLGSLPGA